MKNQNNEKKNSTVSKVVGDRDALLLRTPSILRKMIGLPWKFWLLQPYSMQKYNLLFTPIVNSKSESTVADVNVNKGSKMIQLCRLEMAPLLSKQY